MRLIADNIHAQVEGTPDELHWLAKYLTVPVKNAEHSEAYQAGNWDGSVKLFNARRSRIASGLIRLVAGRAKEAGVEVQVVDARVKPAVAVDEAAGAWLRDYQREALAAMLRRGRGIVQAPQGSGKTEIFAAMTQAVPVRWLVLVDTTDLMHQAADRILLRTGERPGLAGDSEWNPRRVTVATFHTILRGLGGGGAVDALLNASQGLVADEVQVLASTEFNRVAMSTPNAWWRYGLSATALEREDEADYRTIEAIGPMIHEIPVAPLFAAGILARPEIWMVEHEHEKMTGSWGEVYEAGVLLNEKRNAMLVSLAASRESCPRPTLVFHKAILHGRKLAKMITPYASTELLSGKDNTWRRDSARKNIAFGETDVLVVSRIFNKGVDLPTIESGVNAAAGKSVIDALQKVGRLMRVAGGKLVVVYWDVYDKRNRWLEYHAHLRLNAYRKRGYQVNVITQANVAAVCRGRAA